MATGFIMVDTPNPYTAQGVFPRRGGAALSGTCIVHTSEGNWQAGVEALTNLVRTRTDYGCYHQACDWVDIARYYPWIWECWQDSETNNWAVGISAACRTSDWGNMPADIEDGFYRNMGRMAAEFVADMADYGITVPLRRITGTEARNRVPGFCAHGDSGIGRTDPGANFDWARFFNYTRQALDGNLGTEDTLSATEVNQIIDAIKNKNLTFDDRVFIQNEIERRHQVTRDAINAVRVAVLDAIKAAGGSTDVSAAVSKALAEYELKLTKNPPPTT